MRIMKFEGSTMREAIANAKAQLGDQAVIISSRQIRKGLLGTAVEISAALDDDNLEDDRVPAFAKQPLPRRDPAPAPAPDLDKLLSPLRSELRSLRALVRSNTHESQALGKLESELVALRQLVEKMGQPASPQMVAQAVGAVAAKRRTVESEPRLVAPSTARIVMLVGPTGAGKTTTIAKLAAHASLVEGRRVQVITLDTYRVGGVDQIRTFTDLIGVPLTVLDDCAQLARAVDTDDELILIDTAGRSPRDIASVTQLAAACESIADLEVHLVTPASASTAAIDALVAHYAPLSPARLLFTKLDEQDTIPELLAAPRRVRLPITWVTTGQCVPEDLEQPTANRLGELAMRGITGPAPTSSTQAA
jgi:flagellar biosynthesis protein FlhF